MKNCGKRTKIKNALRIKFLTKELENKKSRIPRTKTHKNYSSGWPESSTPKGSK
jgi:hypothetical protein